MTLLSALSWFRQDQLQEMMSTLILMCFPSILADKESVGKIEITSLVGVSYYKEEFLFWFSAHMMMRLTSRGLHNITIFGHNAQCVLCTVRQPCRQNLKSKNQFPKIKNNIFEVIFPILFQDENFETCIAWNTQNNPEIANLELENHTWAADT